MVRTAIVPCVGLATNRRSPLGETAIEFGLLTGGGGAGGGGAATTSVSAFGVRLPEPGSTVYELMSPEIWLATNKNGPVGDMATETGPLPVGKIFGGFTGTTMLVVTGTERLPLLLLMSSWVTSLPEKSAIYRKSPEVCAAREIGLEPTAKFGVPRGASVPVLSARNSKTSLVP